MANKHIPELTERDRAALGADIRAAFQRPVDPDDNGDDLPEAPPIPTRGQQTVAIFIKKP